MGIKTVPRPPYSPDFAPCDFWLFPKLRGCRYETIDEMKEAVTKIRGCPWGVPEVVRTVQQVHCSRRRLLRRGLEFHECTINKSAHTKSLETYCRHLVSVDYRRYLPLQRGKDPPPNECPGYDTKQSVGEVPVMLRPWGIRSTLHCHCSQIYSGQAW